MKKQIKINGKKYVIKYTIRALFIFEKITNKSFKVESLLDSYILMYAMLLANNENVLSWDEFLDAVDENPNLLNEMDNVINDNNEKLFPHEENDDKKKV